jgi:hypothetical protein
VIVMRERKPPRPPIFKPRYGAEESPMIVTWVSPRDPSRKGPGRPAGPSPRSLANAERAADYVLRQQAKRPSAKETTLIDEAVGKLGEFHVSPGRVRAALKAMKNKEKSRL